MFDRLDLEKPPLTIFSVGKLYPVWAFLQPPLPGVRPATVSREESIERFVDGFTTYRVSEQDFESGPFTWGKGDSEVVCMQALKFEAIQAVASCWLLRGEWRAEFVGDARETEKFFGVVRDTRLKK
jgi:hypothetical protein